MKKTLGILGGMGPQATIDFQQKVLNHTIAKRDQEHIRVITDSHPQIPDRVPAIIGGGVSPVHAMQNSLNKLIRAGAQCIAMPCVTAHYFLPGLKVTGMIKFLNMLEIAAEACRSRYAGQTAGVLCTEGTAKSGIVTAALEKAGVSSILPAGDNQKLLGRLILDVKAKGDMEEITGKFERVAAEMSSQGADYFLLACTEIPLIIQAGNFSYTYVDSTAELAKAAVKACGYAWVTA